ncbi:MAG: sporulation protein YqfC [Firmicutes bacterium]|nr:sporulation protein YqfC [Bacillota bacterium]
MGISGSRPDSGRAKERIAEFFELPRDSIIDVPRIVVVGCGELSIENHLGITEYTSRSVSVATVKGNVTVRGKDLAISSISKAQIGVQGTIEHLDLPVEPR